MKRLFPAIYVFSCLIAAQSFAGSATWSSNPISGDWNTAANWTPATVPNGPTDVATFDASGVPGVNLSSSTTVDSIVFSPGANGYTINVGLNLTLTLSGAGLTNNSGVQQELLNHTPQVERGIIKFGGDASAGDQTTITNGNGATTRFNGHSSAGSAMITNQAPIGGENLAGATSFSNSSTAGNATIVNEGHMVGSGGEFGSTGFSDSSTAANATIILGGGGSDGAYGAVAGFVDETTADHATFTLNGGIVAGANGPVAYFEGTATGADAVFTINGGTVADAGGSELAFVAHSSAGNATIVVNGGAGKGGSCEFGDEATGGTARIGLFDTGYLTIFSQNPLTIGSIEGSGVVNMGSQTLSVGANNLSTTFSGVIGGIGNGGLTKIGTGILTLSGANTYLGATQVNAGTLRVSNLTGSATSTGVLNVQAGTLAGQGIIAGATTIGTGGGSGAFLAPGKGSSQPATLTIQNALTFKADGTYTYKLNTKKAKADQVIANGVTIEGGAQFDLATVANKKITAGTVFTAISNSATTPISGTFANLADGSTVTVGVNKLQVSYSGGDGNDLTLTVVQ